MSGSISLELSQSKKRFPDNRAYKDILHQPPRSRRQPATCNVCLPAVCPVEMVESQSRRSKVLPVSSLCPAWIVSLLHNQPWARSAYKRRAQSTSCPSPPASTMSHPRSLQLLGQRSTCTLDPFVGDTSCLRPPSREAG